MESSEHLPKLTRRQFSEARVIAKGRRIRDVQRLVNQYGGHIQQWTKKGTQPFFYQNSLIEVHWYDHHGLGQFETKIKWLD